MVVVGWVRIDRFNHLSFSDSEGELMIGFFDSYVAFL